MNRGTSLKICLATWIASTMLSLHAATWAQDHSEQRQFLAAGRKAAVERVAWEKSTSLTFDDPGDLAEYKVVDGAWEIKDGKLWAAEGEKSRTILLAQPAGDSLRVEFEATSFAGENGLLGDVTLLLNSAPGKAATAAGYALTTGSYYNTCTTFYRTAQKLARTEYSPLVSGKPNSFVIELHRGHLRFAMNGEILLEAWDSSPLQLDPALWLGLRTYATTMSVDNLTVYRAAK